MPIYEYKCKNCDFEFELLLFPGEEALCPKCNSKNLDKKVSLVRIGAAGSETNTSEGFSSSEGYNENSSDNSSRCASCSGGNCSTCR